MRQGLLLDLLFRTPAIPPSATLAAIILNGIFRVLRLPPILGNIDTAGEDELSMRKRRSFTNQSRSFRKRNGYAGTRNRLFGGRAAVKVRSPSPCAAIAESSTEEVDPPRFVRRPESVMPEEPGDAPAGFVRHPESAMQIDDDDGSDRASASWV